MKSISVNNLQNQPKVKQPIRFVWQLCVISFVIFNGNKLQSQTILNGSFEINNGNIGYDYINLSNNQFNNLVEYCYSFGENNVANLDLISDDFYEGGSQHGYWYVALTKEDSLSLELSDSLVAGEEYKVTFYDRSIEQYGTTNVIIGVSNVKNSFGSVVFKGNQTKRAWSFRHFSFIAPFTAKFITVRIANVSWGLVDNFCLSQEKYCVDLPEIEMANVFTPNNDGINDVFKPVVFKGMKNGRMLILNRWGQVVFETDDPNTG